MTRAEVLHHALAFALRKVHLGPERLKLDEETRWQIGGEAIEELRRYGGWKELEARFGEAGAPCYWLANRQQSRQSERFMFHFTSHASG